MVISGQGANSRQGHQRILISFNVIIPAYKRATPLPFTLDAILAQTPTPAEVIVVDDSSADAPAAVADRCAPRVHRIAIANSGNLAARNVGLEAATRRSPGILRQRRPLATGLSRRDGDAVAGRPPDMRVAYGDFFTVRGDL